MSIITGKIISKAVAGALAVAAVAVAGDATMHTGTHHTSVTTHLIASADNNNPGPEATPTS